ncbi:hypothetical protein BFP71_14610 [Roseivirga misakiensis]|uniref:Uncharacterized protein n=1 Tax=Roseivirga misakiensis TaxID=1563681 RepID=A0A1E5SZX6_9BACT|nr:hypothetical protein BFP71_14610 [Roseivirga misakiensis]
MKLFRFEGLFGVNIQNVSPKYILTKVREKGETIDKTEVSPPHPWIQFLVIKRQQIGKYLLKKLF